MAAGAVVTALLAVTLVGPSTHAVAARHLAASRVACSIRAARAPRLRAPSATQGVPAPPFGVAVAPGGRFAFVGLGTAVGVLALEGGRLRPRFTIPLPGPARGLALSPGGRYLVVADGEGGAWVLGVASAERGSGAALLGHLTSSGHGAIEASVAPGGRFVFVTLETSNKLAVFNLRDAVDTAFAHNQPVGVVPVEAPVGLAVSVDGRYLYVTSEVGASSQQGTLTVLDVARAETNASRAVLASVPAGCDPVRVVAVRGSVYVSARQSDSVLWISARALVRAPSHALRATVRVGAEPVGMAVVDHGWELLVADSDRYHTSPHASLALLRLRAGARPVLDGYLGSGGFPRDIATADHGDRALIADYGSSQLQTVWLDGHRQERGAAAQRPLRSANRCDPASAPASDPASAPASTSAIDRPRPRRHTSRVPEPAVPPAPRKSMCVDS